MSDRLMTAVFVLALLLSLLIPAFGVLSFWL